MSGTAVRVGRLTALWLLAAALAPVGWISLAAAASTGQETTLRPPTLLWKSYPLEQRPSTTEQAQAGPASLSAPRQRSEATRQAAQPGSPEVQPLQNLLIVSALLATLVATMAAILLLQSSVPARVGGFRRARDGARLREPARRPSGPMPPRRKRRRPQEVTGRPIADPHAQPMQPAVPEPSAPELEPVPEQAVERREWESEEDQTRELPLELQLRVTTRSVPKGTTEEGPPPHRHRARQTRASVESCEIRLWRGYVKCQLYATVRGSDQAFALSRQFRLRDEDAPSAKAQRALADLLVELAQGGWTVVLDGPIWYQHWLQRAAVTTELEGLEMGPPGLDQGPTDHEY
jgi:hypothetical protein